MPKQVCIKKETRNFTHMKKILVPTDFSPPAQTATDVAASIAMKEKGQLVLLHVIELPSAESFNVEGEVLTLDNWEDRIFSMKLIEGAKQKLERLSTDLRSKGIHTTIELRLGTPFHGIRKYISEQEVDLVVMGTAGHSKLEEMIIGSNTEKVVRHSNCPVLTVHNHPVKKDFKNIVYATNLSADEEAFAKVVINTREMYNGTVHLVRINTPLNFESDVKVKKDMEAFAKKIGLKNYTINSFNHFKEEEGIIHFANNIDADLIALSTHGRTGFAHVLAGSIAEDIANHSAIPVLTYVTKRNVQ